MALMSHSFPTFLVLLCVLFITCAHGGGPAAHNDNKLKPNFYDQTCPDLQRTVRDGVVKAFSETGRGGRRTGASLLRLFFHDCFVQGCDASILLDDTPLFTGSEKSAGPNQFDLERAYEVISNIKTEVEKSCIATVSCADIIALAARDSVNLLGGPTWRVPLGRNDSRTANREEANSVLPSPGTNLKDLLNKFTDKKLTAKDLTVLSGAHTIGQGRCRFFRNRIYDDDNIDASFAAVRQKNCTRSGGDDNNLAPNDVATTDPDVFDNGYYVNLVKRMGLFHSDQELFDKAKSPNKEIQEIRDLVVLYSENQDKFFADFAESMVNLGDLAPPESVKPEDREVRLDCKMVNPKLPA